MDPAGAPHAQPAPSSKAAKNKKKKLQRKKKQGAVAAAAATGAQQGSVAKAQPPAAPPRSPEGAAEPPPPDDDGESYKSGSGTECSDSDFEGNAGYRRGGYHPVHVGEVYNSRYTVLKKLGWGHFSTVWLSLDNRTGKQVALKVQKSADNYTDAAYDEIELLKTTQAKADEVGAALTSDWYAEKRRALEELRAYIEDGAPEPPEGSEEAAHLAQLRAFAEDPLPPEFDSYVVGLVDHFIHTGPHGNHMCMVFEALGDNLLALIKAYKYHGIPVPLVRKFTRQICLGLDFLHRHCGIIHTDLKPENVLLTAKLPPPPKAPEELEGCELVERPMTEEELAKADQRERTRARKLGLMSPAAAARARARATGSAADAAAAVAALEAELVGLSGAERRKLKKRLRKKVRGVMAAPDARDVEEAAALLAPALSVASNFTLLDAEATSSQQHEARADAASSAGAHATSAADAARVLNASGLPFSLHAEEPAGVQASRTPLDAAAAVAAEYSASIPATVPVLLLASQAYLVSRLCAFATPAAEGSAPTAAEAGDGSDVDVQLSWSLPVFTSSGRRGSGDSKATAAGSAAVPKPTGAAAPLPPAAAVAAAAPLTAASKKAAKRARQRAKKAATASAPATGDDVDSDGESHRVAPAVPPPPLPVPRATLGRVLLSVFPGVPGGALPHQLWRTLASSFAPGASLRTPVSAHGDLRVWRALLPAAALAEAVERLEAELPHVAFLVTHGLCAHVPGVAFQASAATASPAAEGPLFATSNGAAAWLQERTLHTLGSEAAAGGLRPLHALVGVQVSGPQVPGDLAASLKDGCTDAFAAARSFAAHEGKSRTKAGGVAAAAAAAGAASDGSDAEDERDDGAASHVVAMQCPQLLGGGGGGGRKSVAAASGGTAASVRPFVASEQLRRLAEQSYSGGTFRLRPSAERLAPWFVPAPRLGELLPPPGAAAAVPQAAVALRKVATHVQGLRRVAADASGSGPVAAAALPATLRKTTVTETVRRELTPEQLEAAEARYAADLAAWEATVAAMDVRIVDLGNACWTTKHFSDDIQTRQYRAPEVIIGAPYDTSADVWSLGCMVFELLTGDLMFDPAAGDGYERDEDHLAQMQELLGAMPPHFAVSGTRSSEFFTRDGVLRHIKELRFWGPGAVLADKYGFDPVEASMVDAFLRPVLEFLPDMRATADACVEHPWLATRGNSIADGFIDWAGHPELAIEVLRELQPVPLATPSAGLLTYGGDDEEVVAGDGEPGDDADDGGEDGGSEAALLAAALTLSPGSAGSPQLRGAMRAGGGGRALSAGAAHGGGGRRARSLNEVLEGVSRRDTRQHAAAPTRHAAELGSPSVSQAELLDPDEDGGDRDDADDDEDGGSDGASDDEDVEAARGGFSGPPPRSDREAWGQLYSGIPGAITTAASRRTPAAAEGGSPGGSSGFGGMFLGALQSLVRGGGGGGGLAASAGGDDPELGDEDFEEGEAAEEGLRGSDWWAPSGEAAGRRADARSEGEVSFDEDAGLDAPVVTRLPGTPLGGILGRVGLGWLASSPETRASGPATTSGGGI